MFLPRGANVISHDEAAAVILCSYCEATQLSSVQDIRSLYCSVSLSLQKVNLKFESSAWIQHMIDQKSTGHYHMSSLRHIISLVLPECLVRAGGCLCFSWLASTLQWYIWKLNKLKLYQKNPSTCPPNFLGK